MIAIEALDHGYIVSIEEFDEVTGESIVTSIALSNDEELAGWLFHFAYSVLEGDDDDEEDV